MRCVLLCVAMAAAAAEGPRIYIDTDMEGVGGVYSWDEQVSVGQRRFEESRRLLIGEINAAVAGAYDGGASEVVVFDGHDSSRTLSIAEIDRRAKLIQGGTPANYHFGPDRYEGIMIIGQHAKAGTPNGLLAHTQSRNVKDTTINGRSVGEIGQEAAIAGYFKIPIIMLSGDQAACDELRELQPKAETVAVKQMVGKGWAMSLSHAEACDRIRQAAQRAVKRVGEFSPWVIQGPVEMRIEYYPESKNGETRQAPPRVYQGSNVLEVYQKWLGR